MPNNAALAISCCSPHWDIMALAYSLDEIKTRYLLSIGQWRAVIIGRVYVFNAHGPPVEICTSRQKISMASFQTAIASGSICLRNTLHDHTRLIDNIVGACH